MTSKLGIDYNLAPLMGRVRHGRHTKDLIVYHETVSPNALGLDDMVNVARYLVSKGYGIHGMTDREGHIAWARGYGDGVFWHCGGVNERSMGVENVSEIPARRSPDPEVSDIAYRRRLWWERQDQLKALAKLTAAYWRAWDWPESRQVFSDGTKPGVTSHWNVSQHYSHSQGHTDCWPTHLGGYFPILQVIRWARQYYVNLELVF